MKRLLILSLLFAFAGINLVKSQDKLISSGKIPILAWYSIPAEETSVSRYRELKESGITYNLSFFPNAESMAKGLETVQKAGIKMIVYCPELKTNTRATVQRFMNHPAVAGYMLGDGRSA